MTIEAPEVGEVFIRRRLGVPDGNPEQRLAWARASGGGHVIRVLEAKEGVGLAFVHDQGGSGVYRCSLDHLRREFEQP